ncbi:uncharacterized protein LOC106174338 [Lingula anatina]|uniref:Uncharacterized protein LOC106174338 n=1 Tax=Lingula anatina TaxID=7574 RepID=A0A1S3JLR4_LINAN|nr:uncharacterized protein LOC106174338 [Lingula anatina]|eukprot:XP_013411323.1 uncharacterized protein LOC106174338 [Lingula anatina]
MKIAAKLKKRKQMAPVRMKYVVSFSSQDEKHPVENLLCGEVQNKKWLCSQSDRKGHIEATIQLEQLTQITHIDIGSYGCFTVSVQVGLSTWPQDRPYQTLIPAFIFMSLADSKLGKNKVKAQMFNKDEHFDKDVSCQKWDRVKILCSQPFKKESQFGLMFLRILAASSEQTNENKEPFSPPCNKSQGRNLSFRTPQDHKTSQNSSPAWKSANQIKKHFFGDKEAKDEKEEHLKNRLVTIASTSSNGPSPSDALPRTAQLVLKASTNLPQYSVKRSTLMKNNSSEEPVLKKSRLTFVDEVKTFLREVNFDVIDMDTLTFADLRHQMEKLKCRKLCKEEKKLFLDMAQAFITEMDCDEKEIKSLETSHSPHSSRSENVEGETRIATTGHKGHRVNHKPDISSSSYPSSADERNVTVPQSTKGKRSKRLVYDRKHSVQTVPDETQVDLKSTNTYSASDNIQDPTECPICGDTFSRDEIEHHAAMCGEVSSFPSSPSQSPPWMEYPQSSQSQSSLAQQTQSSPFSSNGNVEKVSCPICGAEFSVLEIEEHADSCVQMQTQGFSVVY